MNSFTPSAILCNRKGVSKNSTSKSNVAEYTTNLHKSELIGWLKKYSSSSSSYLTLDENIKYFSISGIDGYIGYVLRANVAVALGDPICSYTALAKLVEEFKSFCLKNKWRVCFFGSSEERVKIFKDRSFKVLYIGSEPFVALDKFTVSGSKMESIRRGINHAKRAGVRVEECYPIDSSNKVKSELEDITKDWLYTKKMPELSFMVGKLSFNPERRYFIARKNGVAIAFAVYNPIYATKSYYLDLNRRTRNAPNGTMEYLLVSSFEKLKYDGVQRVNLGLSPFSNTQDTADNSPLITKLMKFLYEHFDFFYPTNSEYFFKQKFSTGYERKYMCCYPRISLKMLYAIFLAFCTGGIKEMISYKLKRAIGVVPK